MDATRYLPIVAWRTLAKNIIFLTHATLETPATYRVTVKVIDVNEIHNVPIVDILKVGYYLKDFVGHTYRIIAVNAYIIDISDDFRVGVGPQSGRQAIIYKSV